MVKISDYTHEIITNWARWCLSGRTNGHCMSLEHRYIDPSNLGREVKPRLEINSLEAAEIEKVISAPSFPKKQRRLIINEYVWKREYRITCRELGIRYAAYDAEVLKAIHIFENRINFNNSSQTLD